MRGVYTVSFDQQTIAAASGDYDFFEITPADDRPCELVGLDIGNKSEIGDAQEEFLAWGIFTDNTTSGNGSTGTIVPTDPRDGTAGFTAETVASTPASAGTAVRLFASTFNIRSGLFVPYPEILRFKVDQADTMLCIRLLTALADDAVFSGTAWIREL